MRLKLLLLVGGASIWLGIGGCGGGSGTGTETGSLTVHARWQRIGSPRGISSSDSCPPGFDSTTQIPDNVATVRIVFTSNGFPTQGTIPSCCLDLPRDNNDFNSRQVVLTNLQTGNATLTLSAYGFEQGSSPGGDICPTAAGVGVACNTNLTPQGLLFDSGPVDLSIAQGNNTAPDICLRLVNTPGASPTFTPPPPTNTATPTPTASNTATPPPSPTDTATTTPTPSNTVTTPSPTDTATTTPTASNTATPASPTNTATTTPTPSDTATPSPTITGTPPSPTNTATQTPTPSVVVIRVGSASGAAGETVTISVTIGNGNNVVLGTQNDIAFSPEAPIAAVPAAPGTPPLPQCTPNAQLGQDLTSFAFLPSGCIGSECTQVRAAVLASPPVPIPDGSTLYTCNVAISAQAAPGPKPLGCSNAFYADSNTNNQSADCTNGEIVVGP